MTTGGDELFVTIGGKDVGLQALLQRVDAEMAVSANKAVQLGQSYARLAQAQGKPALSSQVLAGTIGQAGAASQKALIGIETQAARVGASSSYFQQFGSAAKTNLLGMIGPAAAATAAIAALKGSFDLAQSSAKIDATRQSFDHLAASVNTTGDALLNRMHAAAEGTVSDADLIQSANSGLLLTQGKLAADLPRILEISRAAAQATGDDVNFVFNSLVTGIARGSPKIIDNAKITLDASAAMETYAKSIGKSVDQLNSADQQQATLNAVLAAGTQLIGNAGAAAESNAQSFARSAVTIENAKNALGSFLANGIAPTLSGFGALAGAITGTDSSLASAVGTIFSSSGALVAHAQADAQAAQAAQLMALGADEDRIAIGALQVATTANIASVAQNAALTQAAAAVSVQDAQAKQIQAAATQVLELQTRTAAEAFLAMNPNIDAAGIASLLAAGKINASTAAYAQGILQIASYRAQLAGLQAQAGVAAGTGTKVDTSGRGARSIEAAAIAGAQRQRTLATGTTAQQIALYKKEYDAAVTRYGGESSQAYAAQTKIIEAQQKTAKAGGGGGGGGARLSDQQKLQNSLLASQEGYQTKSEDAADQYATQVEKIYQDFYTKMREADKDFNQAQLEGRAGFYDQLGSIESPKIAQAASAAYEQASVEAGRIAQEKGADVAEKYMQAQEQIISARAKRQSDIEQAEKDKDAGKTDYLKGVDALYQKAEDAKLARIKEGEGSLAAEKQKQLDDAAQKEVAAQDKLGVAADRVAAQKITASDRAGKQIDAEALKVDGLTGAYDRLGAAGARAGITPAAGAAAPASTGQPVTTTAAAPEAVGPIESAIASLRDAIGAVERATRDAGRGVERAIGSIPRSVA